MKYDKHYKGFKIVSYSDGKFGVYSSMDFYYEVELRREATMIKAKKWIDENEALLVNEDDIVSILPWSPWPNIVKKESIRTDKPIKDDWGKFT